MSHFTDIFISKKSASLEGLPKRIFNMEWTHLLEIGNVVVHLSKPKRLNGLDNLVIKNFKDSVIIVLGQFYERIDYVELKNELRRVAKETSAYNDPSGHYMIVFFDKLDNSVHVITNRLGTMHVYYSLCHERQAISTYFAALNYYQKTKRADWEALTSYFGNGYCSGDSTFNTKLKICRPSSVLSFNNHLTNINLRQYWLWSHEPNEVFNEKKGLDEFHEILSNSLKNSLSNASDIVLPLSGGLDSRTILGALTHINLKGQTKSFSYSYSNGLPESKIAARLADKRGIQHSNFTVPNYYFNELMNIGDSVEYFQALDGTRQTFMRNWLEDNSDVVVGGHLGDLWLGDMGLTELKNDSDDNLLGVYRKKILKRGSQWLLDNISEKFVSDPVQLCSEMFLEEIHKYKHIDDIDFRFKIYKTEQWSFRWTLSSIRAYQAGSFPVLPFYDKKWTDFFSRIPTELVSNRSFQIQYLKMFHPDLAKVEWQEYGANLYNYKIWNNRMLPNRIISKLRRSVSSDKFIYRNWEVFFLNTEGKCSLSEDLLNSERLVALVDRSKISDLITMFYQNPSGANGYTISMLHSFSRLLDKYELTFH